MRAVAVVFAVAALCIIPLAVSAGEKPAFAKMDTNADGQLTAPEFAACIEACPELDLVAGSFAEMDVDKNGVVTLSEYDAWMPMKQKAAMAPEAEESEAEME